MNKAKLVKAIFTQEEIAAINTKNIKLEKENKMLHKEQWRLHRLWSKDTKHIAELEQENKKLKAELELKNLALKQAQEWSILV